MTGGAAGLNLLLPLPNPDVEEAALAVASAAGIGLGGLTADSYYENDGPAGLIVGYAAAPEHTFRRAVETLASVLREVVT